MRKSGEKTTRRGQEYSQHRSLRMLGAESMMRLDVVLGEARIGRERRLRVTLQSNFVLAVQTCFSCFVADLREVQRGLRTSTPG